MKREKRRALDHLYKIPLRVKYKNLKTEKYNDSIARVK